MPAMWETWVGSLGREDSPGEGNGNPLQCSCLENAMDGGTWGATVHRVAKSWTRLSDFTSRHVKITLGASKVALVVKNPPANAGDPRDGGSILGSGSPLEEGMATHSVILARRIPWTEEPGWLQSTRLQRVGHD